jgi:hypothetical protein
MGGEAPGIGVLAPLASADRPKATAELLLRLTEDLTVLIQTPEARTSKRDLNAFVDALKRVDYVWPRLEGGHGAYQSLEEQVAGQA